VGEFFFLTESNKDYMNNLRNSILRYLYEGNHLYAFADIMPLLQSYNPADVMTVCSQLEKEQLVRFNSMYSYTKLNDYNPNEAPKLIQAILTQKGYLKYQSMTHVSNDAFNQPVVNRGGKTILVVAIAIALVGVGAATLFLFANKPVAETDPEDIYNQELIADSILKALQYEMDSSLSSPDTVIQAPIDTVNLFGSPETRPQAIYDYAAYIARNIQYPAIEKAKNIEGKVYVSFEVEKDGQITNVKSVRNVPDGEGLNREAVRVVSSMPRWNPGKINGVPVRYQMMIPVLFRIK
jgi:periplasmic protein TonB